MVRDQQSLNKGEKGDALQFLCCFLVVSWREATRSSQNFESLQSFLTLVVVRQCIP